MNQFQICFTHNEAGKLQEVHETHEARSRKAAIRLGKLIAYQNGWTFMFVSREDKLCQETKAQDS